MNASTSLAVHGAPASPLVSGSGAAKGRGAPMVEGAPGASHRGSEALPESQSRPSAASVPAPPSRERRRVNSRAGGPPHQLLQTAMTFATPPGSNATGSPGAAGP